jgi:methionine-rich copper-binding protein CopC
VLGVALCAAPSASAHATKTDSNPALAAHLTKLPSKVWIEFDGNLVDLTGRQTNFLIVKDPKGREIQNGKASVGGARITVALKSSKLSGRYVVQWRVVSDDGHPVLGSTFFYLN